MDNLGTGSLTELTANGTTEESSGVTGDVSCQYQFFLCNGDIISDAGRGFL
jgi:hypothetical protein